MSINHKLVFRILTICIVMSMTLFVFNGTLQVHGEAPVQWILTTTYQEPLQTVLDSARSPESLAASAAGRLNDPGLQVTARRIQTAGAPNIELKIEGQGNIDQLRSALHTAEFPINLMQANSHIELTAELSTGAPVEIILDSNPSTGYTWQVDPADAGLMVDEPADSFESVSRNLGAAQKQHIVLTPNQNGLTVLDLYYRRPWEQYDNISSRNTISMKMGMPGDPIDLSSYDLPLPPMTSNDAPGSYVDTSAPGVMPVSFDWRTTGDVSPVKDQGSCGTCWAFGTIGVMESALLIAANDLQDLSEQYVVSCNSNGYNHTAGNPGNPYDCGYGGWPWDAHDYHINKMGVAGNPPGAVLESTFPYTSNSSGGTHIPACPTLSAAQHPYRLASKTYVNPANINSIPSVDSMKQAIYNHGPLSVSVCVGPSFGSTPTGIYQTEEKSSCGGWINHSVVLVGWGEEAGIGYWILKNSWGTWWGDQTNDTTKGFIKIKWGISNIGYQANYVTYTPPPPPAAFLKTNINNGFITHLALNWAPAGNAISYNYCLDQDSTPDGVCDSGWSANTTNTFAGPFSLVPYTTYEWQVRANNSAGTTYANGSVSSMWAFTTGGNPGEWVYLPLSKRP